MATEAHDIVAIGLSLLARASLAKVAICQDVLGGLLGGVPRVDEGTIVESSSDMVGADYVDSFASEKHSVFSAARSALERFSTAADSFVTVQWDFERIVADLGGSGTGLRSTEWIRSSDDAYDALDLLGRTGHMAVGISCEGPYEAELRRLAGSFDGLEARKRPARKKKKR